MFDERDDRLDGTEDNNDINNEITHNEVSNHEMTDNVIPSDEKTNTSYTQEVNNDQVVESNDNINLVDNISQTTTPQVEGTQKIWHMQDFQQNTNGNSHEFRSSNYNNYYKESYKKPNSQKSNVWKYILVSFVSSIIGGTFIAIALLVVAPAIQPDLKNFVGDIFPNTRMQNIQQNPTEIKKVEIVQSEASAITSVAEKVGPSVVGIKTTYQNSNALFGIETDGGEGSGIVISTDGYILTNHHVVEGAINDRTRGIRNDAKIQVYLPNRIDKPYTASLKGYDSKTDLAVLKIEEVNLPAIEFGNSEEIKVGEPTIAIGNPGGLEYMGSLTTGVVSGLNRTVQLDGGRKIRLIQTDAAINPGNSGGPLVNIKGQLIGVNTIKMVATGFEGLGFAIPVNDAKAIADELVKNTYISKPYLGLSIDPRYTKELAKANDMPEGVYVASVEMLGAAQKGGIRADDVITKFNNKTITSFDELEEQKNKFKPGDTVELEVYREKSYMKFNVTLGETK